MMSDAAAWVQAIGSIIAIIVAALIPLFEEKLRSRRAKLLAKHLAEKLIDRIESLIASSAIDAIQRNELASRAEIDLGGIQQMLNAYPLDRLTPSAAKAVLEINGYCQFALRSWTDPYYQAVDGGRELLRSRLMLVKSEVSHRLPAIQ